MVWQCEVLVTNQSSLGFRLFGTRARATQARVRGGCDKLPRRIGPVWDGLLMFVPDYKFGV